MEEILKDYTKEILHIRKDFPFFNTPHGQKLIYMDSAATTLKPQSVIDSISKYNTEYSANIHRAVYDISQQASTAYEQARETIANFIGAEHSSEVIFTAGTTAGINHFSRSFAEAYLKEGDRIVISEMEHHANILPWQKIAKDFKCILAFIPLKLDGELDLSAIDDLLSAPTKLLAISSLSNVLGTINPITELTAKCKKNNIYTFIDGAQSVPHMPYSLKDKDLNIDFMVFSGHKMYAPTGVGIFYGKKELLKKMPPFFLGGGMVYDVSMDTAIFSTAPSKFEAGTPPIAEVIAFTEAIKYLEAIGWETIKGIDHQHLSLGQETFNKFKDYIKVFGTSAHRAPIFSFQVNEIHPHDIGSFFNEFNIGLRTGHQCTQPTWKRMGITSVTRASTGIYNTPEEWEYFEKITKSLLEFFNVSKFS